MRAGAIIPLRVQSPYTKMGSFHSKDYITLLITKPIDDTHSKNVHEFKSSGYKVTYTFNKPNRQMDIFVSSHETNRFIVHLNEVNVSPIVVRVRTQPSVSEFQTLKEERDEDNFWRSTTSSVYKPTLTKAFIKITENATYGLHIKITNIN